MGRIVNYDDGTFSLVSNVTHLAFIRVESIQIGARLSEEIVINFWYGYASGYRVGLGINKCHLTEDVCIDNTVFAKNKSHLDELIGITMNKPVHSHNLPEDSDIMVSIREIISVLLDRFKLALGELSDLRDTELLANIPKHCLLTFYGGTRLLGLGYTYEDFGLGTVRNCIILDGEHCTLKDGYSKVKITNELKDYYIINSNYIRTQIASFLLIRTLGYRVTPSKGAHSHPH